MKKFKYIALTGVLALMLLLTSCGSPNQLAYKHNLIGLEVTSTVSGKFFLGTGDLEGKLMWVYRTEGTDGLGGVLSEPSNHAVYKEDITDGQTPYVEKFICPVNGLDLYCNDDALPQVLAGQQINYYLVFHIPPGSITTLDNLGITPATTE